MKNITLLLMVMFTLSVSMYGQEEKRVVEADKNEIGLNVTMLLSNIFGFNNNYVYDYYPYGYYYNPNGQYLASYKRYFNNSAFRFAIGGNISTSNSSGQNDTYQTINTNQTLNVRAGYELEYKFASKFNFYYGLDVVFNNSNNGYKIENNNPQTNYSTSNSTVGVGGGPVAGISWYLNNRLKLSTETSLYFISTTGETEVTYELTPELNTSYETNTTELRTNFPIFLNLELLF